MKAHTASCPSCREELTFLETVSCDLVSLKGAPEPTDIHEQIMQKAARTTVRTQQLLREKQATGFTLFRPSLGEILAAALLASKATFYAQPVSQPRSVFPLLYTGRA